MIAEQDKPCGDQHGGILYKDEEVIIVDIPGSLSSPAGLTRFSGPVLKTPYNISDPKSGIPFDQGLLDLHKQLQESISQAFEILRNHDMSLCLPRLIKGTVQTISSEDEITGATTPQDIDPDFQAFSANLSAVRKLVSLDSEPIYLEDVADEHGKHSLSLLDVNDTIIINSSSSWKTLDIPLNHHAPTKFLIPPKSSFLQSTFLDSIPIINKDSQSQELPGFDLILLDPPWHNKSVRRAKNTYHTSGFRPKDLYKLNLGLTEPQDGGNLKTGLLRNQGIIAVWITNNTKIRTFLMDMFDYWKLEYIGEWVWVKLTEQGESIFDMESISRKPYELLLLARRNSTYEQQLGVSGGGTQDKGNNTLPRRKVIFACPELHSRKPCIKGELIGSPLCNIAPVTTVLYLMIYRNYRALSDLCHVKER